MVAQAVVKNFASAEMTVIDGLIDRDQEVRALLTCLVAGQNALLVGAPGTAKSMLARRLAEAVSGARYFEVLLSQFTTPDELFGPVKLSSLEQDVYERATQGYLPEAEIAFVDEVMRGSSAILNSLLGVMSDHKYVNGQTVMHTPTVSVIGATNDIPTDPKYAALWDRFLVRMVVNPLGNKVPQLYKLMARGIPAVAKVLTLTDIEQAQAEARALVFDADCLTSIGEIQRELTAKGIAVSDRRWAQCYRYLQAAAWLNGDSTVNKGHLVELLPCLWSLPEQIPTIDQMLAKRMDPVSQMFVEAQELAQDGLRILAKASGSTDALERNKAGAQATKTRRHVEEKQRIIGDTHPERALALQQAIDALAKATEEFTLQDIG